MVMRLSLVAAVALCACSPKNIDIEVNVVSTVCDPTLDPFGGVNWVQVRVTGDGIETPLFENTERAAGSVKLPEIPSGKARVIEVRGYGDDPTGSSARPISIGRSLPFDLEDVVTDSNRTKQVNVFLRLVDSFTPPSSQAAPGECSRMRVARAGHTATLLQDGRVFIAGGYRLDGATKVALADAEIFNPQTGTFEDTQKMSLSNGTLAIQKAFHTATLLKNGQVLLYGGEVYVTTVNSVVPQTAVLIYDATARQYGAVPTRTSPPNVARTQHAAVADASGRVLIVGGVNKKTGSFAPIPEVEWFDPVTNTVNLVDSETLGRTDIGAASVQGNSLIAVAGGTDGTSVLGDVVFYKFDDSRASFTRQATTQQLKMARRSPGAIAMGTDSNDLVLIGGYTNPTMVAPDPSSEIVKTHDNMVDLGPTIGTRGNVCTARMTDDRALTVGGRTVDAVGMAPHSDGTAVVVSFDSRTGQYTAGTAAPLKTPRWAHTCTTLSDGSVLVTGGLNEGPTSTILQDAWIYTPIPPP